MSTRASVDLAPREATPTPAVAGTTWLARLLRRLPDTVTCAVVVAMAGFVLGGIGLQVAGVRVLTDTSSLTTSSVYRDGGMPQSSAGTLGVNDTIDAATPSEVLFGEELRDGVFAAWNPYALGGAPLAATPNYGLMSPLAIPFWVLPGWLAPAYVKLLECIVAIGGTYLFLRRLRLRPAAATLGGLVFCSSAFLVAWTGWPQTRTAATIPVLFWALERLAQRVRWREVALIALAVACLLFAGFPTVTAYALLTGAAYLAVRLLATRPLRWPTALARGGAAAAGVLAGVALTAWQLVPFAGFMTNALIRGREQMPGQHIPAEALLTTIAPYALGSASTRSTPTWFGPGILVESESYIGAAALVLVITAIALASRGRALLPRGVWWFFVGAVAAWFTVIYLGGPPLTLLQKAGYLFSDNFIGRARSVWGFLLACLAAVAFELILARRSSTVDTDAAAGPTGQRGAGPGRRGRIYATALWVAVGAGGVVVYLLGHRLAASKGTTAALATTAEATGTVTDLENLNRQLAIGLLVMAVAGAAVAWLWFGRPGGGTRWARLRTAAMVLIPALIAGQALAWVITYYPHAKRSTFYPTNEVHTFLAEHLGHERFFGAFGAIYGSVEAIHGLRQFHGHGFMQRSYGELADALPGRQFLDPPNPATIIRGETGGGAVARNPILDRAAVREYVAPVEMLPFGDLRQQAGDGSSVGLTLAQPLTATVPVSGPLRGIGVTPVGPGIAQTLRAQIRITLRAPDGTVVADAARVDRAIAADTPFVVPLAGDAIPAGTRLTATISLHPFGLVGQEPADPPQPIALAAQDGRPVLSVVTPTPGDGLRMVLDGQSVIYERTAALPRARWASSTVVEPDATRRLALLASGILAPDQVLLDAPGAATDGAPAQVSWVEDGMNAMALHVDAQGAGYLVLADAIQHGWTVTVDGHPATMVNADHAFVAVAVPAGRHDVRFAYPTPPFTLAGLVSLVTAFGLLVAVAIEARRSRRARGRHAA